jgi:hypothetical protein
MRLPQSEGTLRDERDAILKRLDDRTVELTDDEQLVKEIFDIQLDRGHGMATAVLNITGHDLPPGLRSQTPRLDAIMTPDFVSWLIN